MSDTPLITSDTALREVCQQLASSPFLAVDTEFVREYNYYPQLCLIQVASADFVVCIDPMGGLDLTPLRDILYAPQTVKVMHAAHQDLEAFYHLWSALPQPLFDTQVAAAFLGLGEQIGYAGLVKHFLHLDIDKSQTRTDWRKRPFTQKQLQYAADDVRHLARIYPEVCALLSDDGRLAWLQDEMLALYTPERFIPSPETQWQRIKGVRNLRGVTLAIARELAAWREQTAIQTDKPRRTILSDEWLIDLARLQPAHSDALSHQRNLPPALTSRYAPAIVECVVRAKSLPKELWPQLPHYQSLNATQEALLEALWAIVKLTAQRHNITPSILVTRGDLEHLILGNDDLDVLRGWRQIICGNDLRAFLRGETRLAYVANRLTLAPCN